MTLLVLLVYCNLLITNDFKFGIFTAIAEAGALPN